MEVAIAEIERNDPGLTTFGYREFPEITEQQIVRSIGALKQNLHIHTVYFIFGRRHLTQTVRQNMAELFRTNSAIEYVSFPRKMTNDDFRPIAESLWESTSATTLNLWGCGIAGRTGGKIIKNLLLNNRSITVLRLGSNTQLGLEGVTQIVQAIRSSGCALKQLYFGGCNIGNKGMNELCLALMDNSVLEETDVHDNGITADGYRALARSLPHVKGLKTIWFSWYSGATAQDLQALIQGFLANCCLLSIVGYYDMEWSEEQHRRWTTCKAFVCARNKMSSCLDEFGTYTGGTTAASQGDEITTPIPIPLDLLLSWCGRRHRGMEEVQASLIHHLLCARTNDAIVPDGQHARCSRRARSVTDVTDK